jgi:hypothetical protein
MGYLTGVLLRALEQGPVEQRLARIEAALAANAQQAKRSIGSWGDEASMNEFSGPRKR